jgi:NAD(P)H-hydrate epimerase
MTEALEEKQDGLDPGGVDRVLDMARDVIAIGPGLGQAAPTREFIKRLVDRATMPLVIDADGLNAMSDDPDRLMGREGRDVIITPHPGEMARLVGMSTDEVQRSRMDIARNFASAHRAFVVLKGHRTLIATPDEKVFINPTGNPGMATGGTGDVLTGLLGAILAQMASAGAAPRAISDDDRWTAAPAAAAWIHGAAGDLLWERWSPHPANASLLAATLPEVLHRLA